MSLYRTVLVGTDGSESSYRAVDRAAEVSGALDATLLLVTAYHPMTPREQKAAREELGHEAYKVAGAAPAEAVLNDAAERATKAGAKNVDMLAKEGDPVDVLAEVATERGVDLLVVGNRGLHSLAGRLLGSVPQNISHRSPCDVLIVHTTGR